jgi:hypothetical protein
MSAYTLMLLLAMMSWGDRTVTVPTATGGWYTIRGGCVTFTEPTTATVPNIPRKVLPCVTSTPMPRIPRKVLPGLRALVDIAPCPPGERCQ